MPTLFPHESFSLPCHPHRRLHFQKGNALRDELHVQDVLLLKEMGGNFLRVSHYPQDPVIMEMCDKLGIVTSVEIPVVNAVTETEEFLQNSVEMAKEMVRQDFNRPLPFRKKPFSESNLNQRKPNGFTTSSSKVPFFLSRIRVYTIYR